MSTQVKESHPLSKGTEIYERTERAYSLLSSIDSYHIQEHLQEAALALDIIMYGDVSLYWNFEEVIPSRCQGLDLGIVHKMISYHKHGEKFLNEKWHRIPSLVAKIIDSDIPSI